MKKLAILFGSPSSEREVSKFTALNFETQLSKYKPLMIEWLVDNSFEVTGLKRKINFAEFKYLCTSKNLFIVNALHGEYGEDGFIQKIFEDNHIQFTGPSSNAAKISFDKFRTNELLKHKLHIPCTYKFNKSNFTINSLNSKVKFPIILKPNGSGSSIGLQKVFDIAELLQIIPTLQENTEYLLQECIQGREFSMGTVWNGEIFYNLYPTEIIARGKLFDYHQKYSSDGAEEITPAKVSEELTHEIQDAAKYAHQTLGLGLYSRSDFMYDEKNEKLYFLEVNSLPGFTNTSMLPAQLKYAGMFEKFFDDLVT